MTSTVTQRYDKGPPIGQSLGRLPDEPVSESRIENATTVVYDRGPPIEQSLGRLPDPDDAESGASNPTAVALSEKQPQSEGSTIAYNDETKSTESGHTLRVTPRIFISGISLSTLANNYSPSRSINATRSSAYVDSKTISESERTSDSSYNKSTDENTTSSVVSISMIVISLFSQFLL